MALDQFLKDHGVQRNYKWEDLELEREVDRDLPKVFIQSHR